MAASTSVELLLLRHGIAEARVAGLDHPDRALTQIRRLQETAVQGKLLHGIAPIGQQALFTVDIADRRLSRRNSVQSRS